MLLLWAHVSHVQVFISLFMSFDSVILFFLVSQSRKTFIDAVAKPRHACLFKSSPPACSHLGALSFSDFVHISWLEPFLASVYSVLYCTSPLTIRICIGKLGADSVVVINEHKA